MEFVLPDEWKALVEKAVGVRYGTYRQPTISFKRNGQVLEIELQPGDMTCYRAVLAPVFGGRFFCLFMENEIYGLLVPVFGSLGYLADHCRPEMPANPFTLVAFLTMLAYSANIAVELPTRDVIRPTTMKLKAARLT